MLEKDVLTGMEPYRERVVEPLISDLLSELPALLLVGPRATGKTTTAARYAATTVRLDRPAEAAAFRGDPGCPSWPRRARAAGRVAGRARSDVSASSSRHSETSSREVDPYRDS